MFLMCQIEGGTKERTKGKTGREMAENTCVYRFWEDGGKKIAQMLQKLP